MSQKCKDLKERQVSHFSHLEYLAIEKCCFINQGNNSLMLWREKKSETIIN